MKLNGFNIVIEAMTLVTEKSDALKKLKQVAGSAKKIGSKVIKKVEKTVPKVVNAVSNVADKGAKGMKKAGSAILNVSKKHPLVSAGLVGGGALAGAALSHKKRD